MIAIGLVGSYGLFGFGGRHKRLLIGTTLLFATLGLVGCWGPTAPPDTIPPEIVSTTPESNQFFVNIDAEVAVTFTEEILTADIATFVVTDHLGNTVAGTVTSGTTAVFTPDLPLRHSARYTATVTTAIQDAAENALAAEHSWGFSTRAVPVHGGGWHALAVDAAGNVWAWGANWSGQLGDGTGGLADNMDPLQVVGSGGTGLLSDVVAVAGGNEHSLALRSDGTVWAWGDNGSGQLGGDDGGAGYSDIPLQVLGAGGTGFLTSAVAISAEYYQSFALLSDGTVWAWGDNSEGQMGNGTVDLVAHPDPEQVVGPDGTGLFGDVIQISAGYYHTLALQSNGTVWAWGDDGLGEMGQGILSSSPSPVQVLGPGGIGFFSDALAVEGGEWSTAVIRGDGTLWTIGDDWDGFLGDGGPDSNSTVPVQVLGPGGVDFLTGVTSVASGLDQMAARLSDGSIWAWGANDFAQLGDGTGIDRDVPVQSLDEPAVPISGAMAIASTGYYSYYAVMDDGAVLAWGWNDTGELGALTTEVFNTRDCSSTAVPVGSLDLTP